MVKRLSVMMFLEYAIWGAWAQMLWPYLTGPLSLSQEAAGWIFGLLWAACLLAPFTGGQIADRWVPSQTFLGAAHLMGAVILLKLAFVGGRGPDAFAPWFALMALYSLLYAPTLALTNSIALRHIESDREFGVVRVWGSIGWMVSGVLLTVGRRMNLATIGGASYCDCVLLASVISVAMGVYSFTLPETPPTRDGVDPWAFRKAFILLRDPNTLIFILGMILITAQVQFYFSLSGAFLERGINLPGTYVPAVLAAAHVSEILAFVLLLPRAMRRLGLHRVIVLGALTWPVQYGIFAAAPSPTLMRAGLTWPLVVGALTLHGLGYPLFVVGSQIFIDRVAPRDIRSSAQGLLQFASFGLGNLTGTFWAARSMEANTSDLGAGATTRWNMVFGVPAVMMTVVALVFLVFLREPGGDPPALRR